jgi:6-phosphofructokinase 1
MWTIGVYTSGGDAPGMNAAVRAVVRMAHSQNAKVIGIRSGYYGMLQNDMFPLDLRSVAGVIQRGGTFLQTGRCPEFLQKENRKKAFDNLIRAGINSLVCIGGDGSFRGAHALHVEFGIPVIGVPGTIDNDIYGTDFTIGFDTAVNTALEAIDRIRDTATSHNRIFIVEVMGRDSGYLALDVGIAGGAQEIFIPEEINDINACIQRLKDSIDNGKQYSIFVTAEGQKPGRAYDLCDAIKKKTGLDAKVCILGHIQRGGSPTARDRVIASGLGAGAVDALLRGETDKMAGIQDGKLVLVPLLDAIQKKPAIRKDKIQLARILSS